MPLPLGAARRSLPRAALLGALLALVAVPTARAAEAPPGFRPFAADSVFNLPLRDDAPVSPRSADWVGSLRRSLALHGVWINTQTCAVPIYWADADAPRVRVRLDSSTTFPDPTLIRAWSSVPMPEDAKPADCGDRNLAIYQRQDDGSIAEWELWSATVRDGQWTAKWGGAISDVRTDRGVASPLAYQDATTLQDAAAKQTMWAWNVSASGMALAAGVITREELERGRIDHALAFVVNDAARGTRLWPAQRSDGTSLDPDAIPEGAQLRIDPSVDLSKIEMTPLVRMLAEAAQRYGIVVRDKSYANSAFVTEQFAPDDDPTPALLGGASPREALRAFPWASLQVVDRPSCTTFAPCTLPAVTRVAVDGPAEVGRPLRLDTRPSSFDFPRAAVAWDLDGDGRTEADGGTDPTTSWTPTRAGRQVVGVTTRLQDGTVSRGTATVDVAPAGSAPPPTTTTTTTPAPAPPTTTPPADRPPSVHGLLGGLLRLLGV